MTIGNWLARGVGAAGILAATVSVAASKKEVPPPGPDLSDKPAALQPYFQVVYEEGERSAVLNLAHLGLAAMAAGEHEIATKAFDHAILRIEAFRTAEAADVKAAKRKLREEASKDFKGEPYERGMVYYYRGLQYLRAGDFANAAASFAAVNVEDLSAQDEGNQADYGSMKFLQAWALRCNGETNTAASSAQQAAEMRSGLGAMDFQSPFLVIVETGTSPRKVGDGKYKEKLAFQTDGPESPALMVSDAADAGLPTPVLGEDMHIQASTRGLRPIEYILAGKASFKQGAETTKQVFNTAGTVSLEVAKAGLLTGNSKMAEVGGYGALGGLLIGGMAGLAAKAANPEADTRAWMSIPHSIWLTTSVVPAKPDEIRVTVDGQPVTPALSAAHGTCAVSWAHAAPIPAASRNPAVEIDKDKETKERLKLFQAQFPGMF